MYMYIKANVQMNYEIMTYYKHSIQCIGNRASMTILTEGAVTLRPLRPAIFQTWTEG